MSQEHVELFMHYREVRNSYDEHYGDPDYFGDRVETGTRLTKLLAAIPSAGGLDAMINAVLDRAQAIRGADVYISPPDPTDTLLVVGVQKSQILAEVAARKYIDEQATGLEQAVEPLKKLKEALYGNAVGA